MKLITTTVGLCLTASLLAACGGGSGGDQGGDAEVVEGGTFTMALPADPGTLDPHLSVSNNQISVSQLVYDHLVNVNFDDGSITSGLAKEWKAEGTTVTATLADGITCSDGTKLKASDVAANYDFIADPKNQSPLLGTFLPPGATTKADDAAGTVTITLAAPAPFVLQGLANIAIVCPKGLADRTLLASGAVGTGPYELTKAESGNQYTYTIRQGYTWGPDSATTATKGMPETIVMKVVENESTAANLLLSGELNGAVVGGSDRKRLEAANLATYDTAVLSGEQFYNQTEGRPTVDPKVRMALTQALDFGELQKVLTSGNGKPATTFAALDPVACQGDSVSGALPKQDVAGAKGVLAAANLPELTFVYNPSGGGGVSAAAELAVEQWKAAGVDVKAKAQNPTAIQETVFGTRDWDIAWLPVNVSSPDQLVPFLSGTAAPEGTNFANITNEAYEAGVKKAAAMNGQDGCDTWLEAESALVKDADVIPFANTIGKAYRAKADFEYPGQMVPTSIRMLAN